MQTLVNQHQQRSDDVLAHRLDFDIAVYQGCSMFEVVLLAAINFVVAAFVLSSLAGAFLGMPLMGLGAALLLTLYLTRTTAKFVGRYKEGKPPGYIKQRFLLNLEDKGFYQTPYIRRSGRWSVGRFGA